MLYQPRHRSYKKKANYRPLVFFLLVLALAGTAFFFRQDIRNLFAGDRRLLLEKERKILQDGILKAEPKENEIKEFRSLAKEFASSNPKDGISYHYLALSGYYEFLLLGFRFDSGTLSKIAYTGFDQFLSEDASYLPLVEDSYRNALRAQAIDPEFKESTDNRYLIAFGEAVRQKLSRVALNKLLVSIEASKLSPELRIGYAWTCLLGSSLSGNTEFLKATLTQPEVSGPLLLSAREADFLTALSEFRAGQYVSSLALLRKVRNTNEDFLTGSSKILEARIFYYQNLPPKALALLEEYYPTAGDRKEEVLNLAKEILGKNPTLKSNLPIEE
ncbi:hypothetical protein LEP1GSC047_3142 [Leptospira inadai serovar Lyme str. 10]|uniref:Tetratricopeptide repeat protein n=2 Tax=Leptospira inadai serovar Lyme TaxID=293084 RepID=V6HUG2_9LEPT|nr:hypothetical protein [Leptospira inadai]EQA36404.1 hypothetical protein LEP1GSC047_3142 [Leptospira inadai serovar Lyme str. 10]PNV74645.1 hypothetical protein BES34_012985 [Leptospira inadai serovar Lyme]